MSIYTGDLRDIANNHGWSVCELAADEIDDLERAYALLFKENAELKKQLEKAHHPVAAAAIETLREDFEAVADVGDETAAAIQPTPPVESETPETDRAKFTMPGGEVVVWANFARSLERRAQVAETERDEARASVERCGYLLCDRADEKEVLRKERDRALSALAEAKAELQRTDYNLQAHHRDYADLTVNNARLEYDLDAIRAQLALAEPLCDAAEAYWSAFNAWNGLKKPAYLIKAQEALLESARAFATAIAGEGKK